MINIDLYAISNNSNKLIYDLILGEIKKAQLEVEFRFKSNLQQIISSGVRRIPAIKYGELIYLIYSDHRLDQSIRVFLDDLLKPFEYGNYPRISLITDDVIQDLPLIGYAHRLASMYGYLLEIIHSKSDRETTPHTDCRMEKFLNDLQRGWQGTVLATSFITITDLLKEGDYNRCIIQPVSREEYLSISNYEFHGKKLPIINIPSNYSISCLHTNHRIHQLFQDNVLSKTGFTFSSEYKN